MTRSKIVSAAGALIAAGILAGGMHPVAADTTASPTPAPATASPSPTSAPLTLPELKAKCDQAVQNRLTSLGKDQTDVNGSKTLTSSDRSALLGQISSDVSGLTALDATIQADTTLKQAHADCELIVTNFRVYVLEDPKIHEVIAADTIDAVTDELTSLEPKIEALIDYSNASAANKAQARTLLADLRDKVNAARVSDSGVVALVINLTPSGYPGNAVDLQSGAANIKTARDDLHGARADIDQILKLIS